MYLVCSSCVASGNRCQKSRGKRGSGTEKLKAEWDHGRAERGGPLRIVTADPRVFAAHKLWISRRPDRDPVKRRRDEAQAAVVGQIVARYLTNLPYGDDELRMLPREVFDAARPLFETAARQDSFSF